MKVQSAPIRVESEPDGSILFRSILFQDSAKDQNIDALEPPEVFSDLNLDQVVEAITAGREEYNLKPFFYLPLRDVDSINCRYDVLRDLEDQALVANLYSFAQEMRRVRNFRLQEDKLYYERQKQRWFLNAVEVYCGAIQRLNRDLTHVTLHSRGFLGFRCYLSSYVESNQFRTLVADTQKLGHDLDEVTYSLHITSKRITVDHYRSEADYGADVLQTFERFSTGRAKDYRFDTHSNAEMNHIEAAILDLVARMYPETFSLLEEYPRSHSDYLNATIARFDREIQFYLACIEYINRFTNTGLAFCYPVVSDESKEIRGKDIFDIALAGRLINESVSVVTNDFSLSGSERIFVVSGPNQGGKTTFARAFGQLHYLASIGCPVSGSEAQLFLCDRLFTHFEKTEDICNLSGKLEDELLRIRRILERATSSSILIMNESLLSTTLSDALFLSEQIMQRIVALDMLCLTVTFLDQLASFSEATVSMVSTVDSKDPALRTFKVIRKPADGLAYAAAIAEKYGLTHDSVKTRILANEKRTMSR